MKNNSKFWSQMLTINKISVVFFGVGLLDNFAKHEISVDKKFVMGKMIHGWVCILSYPFITSNEIRNFGLHTLLKKITPLAVFDFSWCRAVVKMMKHFSDDDIFETTDAQLIPLSMQENNTILLPTKQFHNLNPVIF